MPRDLEGLADLVVLTVKNAMAPYQERIALLEKDNADLRAQLAVVPTLRDRVVAVETKSAMPLPAPVIPEPADLSPIQERIMLLEKDTADVRAQLAVVSDLRDRVVVVETKAAMPLPQPVEKPEPVDLTPLIERVVAAEVGMSGLRERFATLETKEQPTADGLSAADVDLRIGDRLTPIQSLIADARERLAAVEVRQPIPGPAGKDGKDGVDGKDGAPGRDGQDGTGWDGLIVEPAGERGFTFKSFRGDRVTDHGTFAMPTPVYRDVYRDGTTYERGEMVTYGGSMWHCNESTRTKPGDGLKAWTLVVKRGRDGKDGRDAMDPVPVVSIKR